MESVIAFSLAGTILQFVDSGTRFAALALRFYRKGADDADDHVHLLKITTDLNALLPELELRGNDGGGSIGITQLAADCGKTATHLLAILGKLKTTRRRDAIRAAFRLIYQKDEIKSLQDQLVSFRNQLNLHLLLSLR